MVIEFISELCNVGANALFIYCGCVSGRQFILFLKNVKGKDDKK